MSAYRTQAAATPRRSLSTLECLPQRIGIVAISSILHCSLIVT